MKKIRFIPINNFNSSIKLTINENLFDGRLCLWIVIAVLFVLNITVLVIMMNNNGKLYKLGHSFGMGYHERFVLTFVSCIAYSIVRN